MDITYRAVSILESCNYILCEDTRISKKLISILNTRGILKKNSYKYISFHSHNEEIRLSSLDIDFFKKDVIFMSDAGMPCISDPGARLVKFMQDNNLEYTILPGASSLSAFCLSGFLNKEFSFFGFVPHKLQNKNKFLFNVLNHPFTSILFESSHRILETINILNSLAKDRNIFIVKEITKSFEKKYFGSIESVYKDLINTNLNGEWVIILEGSMKVEKTINMQDISSISMPPKVRAKLLSILLNKNVEECYRNIIQDSNKDNY